MKVVIAGSRSITSYEIVKKIIEESGYDITTVISGTAVGVDQCGERWAKENVIPIQRFPADWDKHGKSAGFIRNSEMVDVADAVILVHDGVSKGTQHTYDLAQKKGIPIYYATVKKKPRFNPANIDSLIQQAKKTPFISSSLFIEALEYIKAQNVQLSQSTYPLQSAHINNQVKAIGEASQGTQHSVRSDH